MRGTFLLIFMLFIFWAVTMIRFRCTTIDQDACAAICERQGRVFKSVKPGIVKECRCATDWLRKAREEEALRKMRRENRRP